jgi:hypothetical protein
MSTANRFVNKDNDENDDSDDVTATAPKATSSSIISRQSAPLRRSSQPRGVLHRTRSGGISGTSSPKATRKLALSEKNIPRNSYRVPLRSTTNADPYGDTDDEDFASKSKVSGSTVRPSVSSQTIQMIDDDNSQQQTNTVINTHLNRAQILSHFDVDGENLKCKYCGEVSSFFSLTENKRQTF